MLVWTIKPGECFRMGDTFVRVRSVRGNEIKLEVDGPDRVEFMKSQPPPPPSGRIPVEGDPPL